MGRNHPRFIGFGHALKAPSERFSDSIESGTTIALLFEAQTRNYKKCNLSWKYNTVRIVYFDLKTQEENYRFGMTKNSF